jgi:GDP-mannose transporter
MCGLPAPVLAGIAYCTASASMVLLNKFALSSFDFRSITMLLLFQCVFCVVAVYTSSLLGIIKLEVGDVCCSAVRLARRPILESN